MKALVFNGPKDIDYHSFDDPQLTDDRHMIIQVKHCSICGSDLHMYHGGQIGDFDYSQPTEPFCTGHETIGEVVELGKAVTRHRIGDSVLVAGGVGCGECRRCLAGQINLCEAWTTGTPSTAYGISPLVQGGQAEYLQVYHADIGATTIPEGIGNEQALLLTDALSTGYYGIKLAQVKPGDSVAVIGQGPVGTMAAEAAMAVGAEAVYAIDPVASRRERARTFGGVPLHPDEAISRIREDTGGLGVDAVIEAVGVGDTLKQAVRLTRFGGQISILGILQDSSSVPMHKAQAKSISVHGGIAGVVDCWSELIPLVQNGSIKAEGMFSHHFKLAEGARAYEAFDKQADNMMKVLMTP